MKGQEHGKAFTRRSEEIWNAFDGVASFELLVAKMVGAGK
jgi:hypothetical protein